MAVEEKAALAVETTQKWTSEEAARKQRSAGESSAGVLSTRRGKRESICISETGRKSVPCTYLCPSKSTPCRLMEYME